MFSKHKFLIFGCIFASVLTSVRCIYPRIFRRDMDILDPEQPNQRMEIDYTFTHGVDHYEPIYENHRSYFVDIRGQKDIILAIIPGLTSKRLYDEMPPNMSHLKAPVNTEDMLEVFRRINDRSKAKNPNRVIILLGCFGVDKPAVMERFLQKHEYPGRDQTKKIQIFDQFLLTNPNERYKDSAGRSYSGIDDSEILALISEFFYWFNPEPLRDTLTFKFYPIVSNGDRNEKNAIIITPKNTTYKPYQRGSNVQIPCESTDKAVFIIVQDYKWRMLFSLPPSNPLPSELENVAAYLSESAASFGDADVIWVNCPELDAFEVDCLPEILVEHLPQLYQQNPHLKLAEYAIFHLDKHFMGLKFRTQSGLQFPELTDKRFRKLQEVLDKFGIDPPPPPRPPRSIHRYNPVIPNNAPRYIQRLMNPSEAAPSTRSQQTSSTSAPPPPPPHSVNFLLNNRQPGNQPSDHQARRL